MCYERLRTKSCPLQEVEEVQMSSQIALTQISELFKMTAT